MVITIDDGFYSVLRIGFPLLQQNDFPATLYLTTMDMQKGLPILRLNLRSNLRMKASKLLFNALRMNRSYIFTIPGEENMDVVDAL